MTIRRFRTLLTILLPFAVAACVAQPSPQQFAEISFSHLEPIRIDVASIEIVDAFRPTFSDPNVEHRAPTSPALAARRWAEDRLLATGASPRRATYTIEQAAIVEVPLEGPGGVRGLVTNSQSERYDAELIVEIAVFSTTGTREGIARATARRSQTVAENTTLAERERVWQEMVEALSDDINGRLEKTINETLQPFLP